jgi:carbonic anhydrase
MVREPVIERRPQSPGQAWAALLAGNERFAAGRPLHPNQDAAHRVDTAAGQAPFAVVLGCSDSRVAAEIIFDRGIGDLFVVRTAGHLLGTDALASVEFAVHGLRTPLVVILGHDSCGAVGAAVRALRSGTVPPGFQRAIVEHLLPGVLAAQARGITDHDDIGRAHITSTADLLIHRSSVVYEAVARNQCAIVCASYRLRDGQVHLIESIGQVSAAVDRPASEAS